MSDRLSRRDGAFPGEKASVRSGMWRTENRTNFAVGLSTVLKVCPTRWKAGEDGFAELNDVADDEERLRWIPAKGRRSGPIPASMCCFRGKDVPHIIVLSLDQCPSIMY
jgi:hypothetical protein